MCVCGCGCGCVGTCTVSSLTQLLLLFSQAALKNIRVARIGAFSATALCILLRPQIGLAAAMGGGGLALVVYI